MLIKTLLAPELTAARIDCTSKKRVIDTLAQLFAEHIEGVDEAELFTQFVNREKLGSTGLGEGVAIPHCRCESVQNIHIACLSLREAIDFDAIDQQPVDIIFAMVVPINSENEHLQVLSALAEHVQQAQYLSRLRQAPDAKQLHIAATSV